jgi:hypothetical protein
VGINPHFVVKTAGFNVINSLDWPLIKVTVSREFERAYTALGQVTSETDNDQQS